MDLRIKDLNRFEDYNSKLASTISFSVDCDSIYDYINFAPKGATLDHNAIDCHIEMLNDMLDLFATFNIQATFFCIANQLLEEKYLTFYRSILEKGHTIGNHTYSHHDMARLTDSQHVKEIERSHEYIQKSLSVAPRGYRAPAYFIKECGIRCLTGLGYLYDSSVCNAQLTRIALGVLSWIRKDYEVKGNSAFHQRFSTSDPCLLEYDDSRGIMEWPIPSAIGLSYFGTFHCVVPSPVFRIQTQLLRLSNKHIHYELHPIEVISDACGTKYPWVPTRRNFLGIRQKNLALWAEKRIGDLLQGRNIITLEELSAEYLHLLYR